MTITRAVAGALLAALCSSGGAWTAPDDVAVSRLDNVPARPLGPDDLRVTLSIPIRLDDLEGDMTRRTFDLRDAGGLAALQEALVPLNQLAQGQDEYEKAHPERVLPFRYELGSSGKRRALREAAVLAKALGRAGTGARGDAMTLQLLELLRAIENSFRYPVKKNYQIIPEIIPGLLLKMEDLKGVTLSLADGTVVTPPVGTLVVRGGHLVTRQATTP